MTPVQIQKDAKAALLIPKAGLIVRDLAAANGNVSYAGIGFKPSALLFMWVKDAAGIVGFNLITEASVAAYPAATGIAYLAGYNGWYPAGDLSIYQSVNDYVHGKPITFDVDGFTIEWTKTGSPTGQASIPYLALP